jgi:hypothetical protein
MTLGEQAPMLVPWLKQKVPKSIYITSKNITNIPCFA